MKSSNRFALLATVVVALSSLSSVAMAASVSGVANATVLTPIAISAPKALTFGTFAPGTAAGTVVVTSAGARSATNALLSTSVAGDFGRFTVTGANLAFAITAPTTVTLALAGAPSMIATLSGIGTTGTIAGGSVNIDFGGSLAVAAAATQTAGAYTGSFTMQVEYN